MISFDLIGTLFRWRFLDHSAHLGGVLFGMFVTSLHCLHIHTMKFFCFSL